MVHAFQTVLRRSFAAIPYDNAETPQLVAGKESVLVGQVVTDEDRQGSGKGRAGVEQVDRSALAGPGPDQFGDAFPVLDLERVALRKVVREGSGGLLALRAGAVMQGGTVGLGFVEQAVVAREGLQVGGYFARERLVLQQDRAVGGNNVRAVRASQMDRQGPEMVNQLPHRPSADQRQRLIQSVGQPLKPRPEIVRHRNAPGAGRDLDQRAVEIHVQGDALPDQQ